MFLTGASFFVLCLFQVQTAFNCKQFSECMCRLLNLFLLLLTGASCLPFSPSKLMIDVYYYLEKSSKRQASLKCHQVLHELEESKIIKHVST